MISNNNLSNNTNITNSSIISIGFSSNIYFRFYFLGCYYLDKNTATWLSNGLTVLNDTNSTHTHCLSTHLTDFAGSALESVQSLLVLPEPIDFDYVFRNSGFLENKTIYITIIICGSVYIFLLIWCLYMDNIDRDKANIYLLIDNSKLDLYYYEMIVFTGNRPNSGTLSNVCQIIILN